MSHSTITRTYSIKEAASLTGLPASTLRYYESIGVIPPISRGASSKHRVYDEDDLDQLMWVACLAATGMSVSNMRQYVANGKVGPSAAGDQIDLLVEQAVRLAAEAEQLKIRRQYVDLKVEYWRAVQTGDTALGQDLATQARALADQLKQIHH